jgi:hypothetical protein
MLVRVGAFAVRIMRVMATAPRRATRTPPVMIAAEKCGLTRAERRWCNGMSTMASEPPKSTMSITDQKTMNAMMVMIPMTANGKRSLLRSAGMNRDLLLRIGIKDMVLTCNGTRNDTHNNIKLPISLVIR